jgi:hypothetical protein
MRENLYRLRKRVTQILLPAFLAMVEANSCNNVGALTMGSLQAIIGFDRMYVISCLRNLDVLRSDAYFM